MKATTWRWSKVVAFSFAIMLISACEEDPRANGGVDIRITDGAIDDADVKSVFITIADIKVNGKSVSGFSKTTFNLMGYRGEASKFLVNARLDHKTYNNLELVLDVDHDALGTGPGCYVLLTTGEKFKLNAETSATPTVVTDDSWSVTESKTVVVVDFDLRKSVIHDDDPEIRYRFASDHELNNAIRIVNAAKAGTIQGTYAINGGFTIEKIIVYVYKKGTFNAAVETQPQGPSNLLFANSISNAAVKLFAPDKTYTIGFLEQGDYELYYAAYDLDMQTGEMVFQNLLQSQDDVHGSDSGRINVQGGQVTSVSSMISL